MNQKHIKKKKLAIFTLIVFITLTILPNIIMYSGLEKKSKFSKTIQFPEINLKTPVKTISALQSFYLKNYGLKYTFVNSYIDFKKNILIENPIPFRVVEGKEGWFFLGNYYNNILDNTYGVTKYSDIDLYRIKQNLLDLKVYLKSINVDFYLAIIPEKSTIYREKLPYKLTERDTPLSQFLSIIKSDDNLNIIDLRHLLTRHKDSALLYHKTDTHWNHTGAYIAYKEVVENLEKKHKRIKSTSLDHFTKVNTYLEGDITRMINTNVKEKITRYQTNENSSVKTLESNDASLKFSNEEKKLKLLMYRDSFSNYWIDYFNEDFSETIYYRYSNGISKSDIIKAQTDVFILEVGERHFDKLLKNLKLIN